MISLNKGYIVFLLLLFVLIFMSGCLLKEKEVTNGKENETYKNQEIAGNEITNPNDEMENAVPMEQITDIKYIAASEQNSFILTHNGELYSWGRNDKGELGLGHNTDVTIPTKISLEKKIKQIAPGAFAVALTDEGEIYTWGVYDFGVREEDAHRFRRSPVKFDLPEKIIKIGDKGGVGLAISETGALYTWGWNYYGQRGDGTTRNHSFIPHKVDLPERIIEASCTDSHVMALTEAGNVYTWGSNFFGEIGDEKPVAYRIGGELIENNVLKPYKVNFEKKIIAIATGRGASYALDEDGVLYSFGANDVGQLGVGDSSIETSSVPLRVAVDKKVKMVVSGNFHAYALTEDDTLYGWGRNSSDGVISVLGLGTTEPIIYEPQVINISDKIISMSAGNGQTWALTEGGAVYGWGDNSFKQISLELPWRVNTPTRISLYTANK